MSGSSIPYHLRPHKAVDRRLFLDLLSRFERWRPLSGYVYLSMGAYPLEDHKLIHRLIGITGLIAFDLDKDVVARQLFNRPVKTCHCIQKKSGDLIAELSAVLRQHEFPEDSGVIIWLDYTDPKQLGHQIREFQSLLDKLSIGDIVRVTVNAHANDFVESVPDEKPLQITEKRRRQFHNVKSRIGDFLPSDVSPNDMTQDRLPAVISSAFAVAALRALPVSGEKVFTPLSVVRYADGQQMLSITGAVVKRGEEKALTDKLSLEAWPFSSSDWATIHHLVVPNLTIRERLFLEREIVTAPPASIVERLGFEKAADVEIVDFLESYRRYYRFYPTLLTAEL